MQKYEWVAGTDNDIVHTKAVAKFGMMLPGFGHDNLLRGPTRPALSGSSGAPRRSSTSVSERRTPVGRRHYAIRAPGASGPCLSRNQTRAVNLISMSCVGRARRDVVTIVLATAGRSDPSAFFRTGPAAENAASMSVTYSTSSTTFCRVAPYRPRIFPAFA